MATPHDTLFRLAFGRPANARDLLRKALPRSIAVGIDWRSLRVIDAILGDRRLRKSQLDLLFSAVLRGRRVLLYVLIEHKSRDDWWTVLQLFTYMGAIWRRFQRDHPRQQRLPRSSRSCCITAPRRSEPPGTCAPCSTSRDSRPP